MCFQGSPQTRQRECFLVFGNLSLFKTPFLGQDSLPRMELPPYLLCLFFHLLCFSYLILKTMICFSGCLMSSASIQKLFCRIYSALKCSFDEFVRGLPILFFRHLRTAPKYLFLSKEKAFLDPDQNCIVLVNVLGIIVYIFNL